MRRKDREITDPARIESILKRGQIVHLGMVDGDRPYVVPMHYGYVYENGALTLYLHCAGEGRKLDVLRANPSVFAEIETGVTPISGGDDACAYGAAYESVMAAGRAVIVEDPAEKDRGLRLLMKAQTGRDFAIPPQRAAAVTVLRVDAEEVTAKSRPLPQPEAARQEERQVFLDMDNRELFCVLAGDRGVVAQARLRGIVQSYREAHGRDADLRSMVRAVLGEQKTD